jgi:predicted ATPase
LLRDGIAVWRGTGARLATCNHLNLLADVLLLAGDLDGATRVLDESEAHAAETGEQVFLPETYRLRARSRRERREAVALLERAIATARRQKTTLWELRSTLALHRLRPSADSGRRLEAMCRGFDGEPDTRDVVAARAAL